MIDISRSLKSACTVGLVLWELSLKIHPLRTQPPCCEKPTPATREDHSWGTDRQPQLSSIPTARSMSRLGNAPSSLSPGTPVAMVKSRDELTWLSPTELQGPGQINDCCSFMLNLGVDFCPAIYELRQDKLVQCWRTTQKCWLWVYNNYSAAVFMIIIGQQSLCSVRPFLYLWKQNHVTHINDNAFFQVSLAKGMPPTHPTVGLNR